MVSKNVRTSLNLTVIAIFVGTFCPHNPRAYRESLTLTKSEHPLELWYN